MRTSTITSRIAITMKKEIEILARGVLVLGGQLLVCHNRRKGNYFLPGGHIEFGEAAKAALKREIEEEIGLPCAVGCFLGAAEHAFRWKGARVCEINLVFEMRVRGLKAGRPVPSMEKKLEFLWAPVAKLAKSKLEPFPLRKQLPSWLKSHGAPWSSSYGCPGRKP